MYAMFNLLHTSADGGCVFQWPKLPGIHTPLAKKRTDEAADARPEFVALRLISVCLRLKNFEGGHSNSPAKVFELLLEDSTTIGRLLFTAM
jgi:hypothetical protein